MSSIRRSPRCSASAGASCTCPFAVARAGAQLTQWLPHAPLSVDQLTMLQGADNVVSNTDAVDTFQLTLVPLEEQIRRSA